ncbi:hypothetical protein EMIT0347P_80194 [Pseudomonas sp. IT-347P]
MRDHLGRISRHPATANRRRAVLHEDGFQQLLLPCRHGPVHAAQCRNALLPAGTGPRRERNLGGCDRALCVQCIAQPNLADDFLGTRIMKVEPFLTVWKDELAVYVDMFNALHGDSSLKNDSPESSLCDGV